MYLLGSAAAAAEEADNPAVRLFDTGTPSAQPWSEEAIAKRDGWKLVPEDDLTHKFTGDAVILNDKLTVVLPKARPAADVYSSADRGAKYRARVGHQGARSASLDACEAIKIVENGSGAVMLEAAFKLPAAPTLRFRLTTGERILEVRPGDAAYSVVVQTKSRYVVVPDFFGDDVVFKGECPWPIDLPAENFFLGLLGHGDALLMCAWKSNRQEVGLPGEAGVEPGEPMTSSSARITCQREKPIWFAFLEGSGLWHVRPAETEDNWRPPFPGRWRCDRIELGGFADSWDMAKGPAAEQQARKDTGSILIYPFDRTRETPLTAFCLVDLMRNTMGQGPCQYVLEKEKLTSEETPSTPDLVMAWVEKQFERKSAAKVADQMSERFKRMVEQVRLAQTRLEEYGTFARTVRGLCADKQAGKGLLPTLYRIEDTLKVYAKADATPERAGQLTAEIVALVGKDGAPAECNRLGEQVRAIGTAQSTALSKCRMAARWLRSQARMIANYPERADLAKQVQTRAEAILWKP